jgi:hypothetical protein
VTLQIILVFTVAHPKTFTLGHVSVFDKYLHWPHISVSVKKKTLQQDKCNHKRFGHDDLPLHEIHMLYVQLLTLTHTTLVST